ncbi:hypothetical protein B0A54_00729 [Friedmanniomyces endolithicus]|uniref:REJ domain-containing protein n=1 Tax=Friedmanniomyces endolithicus TaxID=329885 RepID=A0A4U0VHY0_9PEZI|nr:hypothetical protein B0A54_00729 [Friedmanniomyces endolithicus]
MSRHIALLPVTLGALLATQLVAAGAIPRDAAIITVTETSTHTAYVTAQVTSMPYTKTTYNSEASSASVAAPGVNPINGLPAVPAVSTSTRPSTYSPSNGSQTPVIIVPTQQSSATLTPVPYGTYTPSGWITTSTSAPSSQHSSSSSSDSTSFSRTPLGPVPTSTHLQSSSTSIFRTPLGPVPTSNRPSSGSASSTSGSSDGMISNSGSGGEGMIGAKRS